MSNEKWLSARDIAATYGVSRRTALRWIMRLMEGEERGQKQREKRPNRLRRVPQSVLEKNLHLFLNG